MLHNINVMPTESETGEKKWITIGGKKIELKPGEEGEDAIRERLPSAKGEKEKATKEALSKSYFKRYGLIKMIFRPRDEVVFDEYRKQGIVTGIDHDYLTILSDSRMHVVEKNHVFKKSELIGDVHWDTLTKTDRIKLLAKTNLNSEFSGRNWFNLPTELRDVIQKINSPAGYDSGNVGTNNPIYNPINTDTTVSQRIKDEIKDQHKDTGKDEEKRDNP